MLAGWHMTKKICIPSELKYLIGKITHLVFIYRDGHFFQRQVMMMITALPWSWWACKHEGGFWSSLGNRLLLATISELLFVSPFPLVPTPPSLAAVGPAYSLLSTTPWPNILFVSLPLPAGLALNLSDIPSTVSHLRLRCNAICDMRCSCRPVTAAGSEIVIRPYHT